MFAGDRSQLDPGKHLLHHACRQEDSRADATSLVLSAESGLDRALPFHARDPGEGLTGPR